MSNSHTTPTAAAKAIGAEPRRKEDDRLLTGRGKFIDDIGQGAYEVAFVRSQHAHAKIVDIDVAAVLDLDGIIGVYTWDDLPHPTNEPLPVSLPHQGLHSPRTQYALARDEVNHTGEPIVMVVARDRYIAEDACSAVIVSYAPLPVCIGVEQAREAEVLVHDDVPDNIAGIVKQGSDDVTEALAAAEHNLELEFWIERSLASPLEGRGVVARVNPVDNKLTLYTSTQVPHAVRAAVSHMLGRSSRDMDVITPDIGGGFGLKGVRPWPEEILIAWAAINLGHDVRWAEDRFENFVGSAQERGQRQHVKVGFDSDGRILAYDVEIDHDIGAYSQYGLVVSQNTSSHVLGPYKVPTKRVVVRALYTNAVMIAPYRGAGRPEGTYALERTLDSVAQYLEIDRVEIRRRNFIQPDDMPFPQGFFGQDGKEVVYDSGDYPTSLDKLLDLVNWNEFEAEKRAARVEGRQLGIGLACYVENTGLGPYEGATVTVETNGTIIVETGLTSQGQGQHTSFSQIVVDELGANFDDVVVHMGSTQKVAHSAGTYASRAAVVSGSAIALASRAVKTRALEIASDILETNVEDLQITNGTISVKGAPDTNLPLATVAVMANAIKHGFEASTKTALQQVAQLGQPTLGGSHETPGLTSTKYFSPPTSSYASGMHAVIVETDPETAEISVLRYCVIHDCGTVINPMLVEGQIHGGVAQGIGGALYERMAYDSNGQLQNASYMDFLMPYVTEIPHIEIDHLETKSPLNPLGAKGAGEAGIIPASAAIASAIEDAEGIQLTAMPISPSELFELRLSAPVNGAHELTSPRG